MTLTELKYIVAVARERHFGRAAESCFVSQPTLSVAIKKLEEELGVALFERGPGEVSVTATGRAVVEQAQRVLEDAARIREIAQAGGDPLAGTLRQMVASGVGITVLPSTSVGAGESRNDLVRVRPFARPVPQRRVALAWRKSFPRPQAIEALREAILECDLPQVKKLR